MKYIKLLCIGLFSFLLYVDTFASTNTYTRTRDNLMVPSDVVVDQNNIDEILKTPAVSSKEKIYDFGDLYNSSEEEKLYKNINKYIDESGIDLVVVTTKDLLGLNISKYAYNFYDYNDFYEDGVILVIYNGPSEPEIFMGNNGSKEGLVFSIYTNERINATLKYIYNDIINGEYYKATSNYITILNGFFNKDNNGNYKLNEKGDIIKVIPWLELIVLSFALTFIIVIILYYRIINKNKMVFNGDINNSINQDTLQVKVIRDDLIDE